jgi:hypothetical protein
MSAALRQAEQNGTYQHCQYNDQLMHENAEAIRALTKSIETLTHYHREMNRWLMIVVCVIALGTKFVEVAKDIWGGRMAVAEGRE